MIRLKRPVESVFLAKVVNLPILIFIIYLLINTYVFRFQRTTLSLSREHLGSGSANYQALLTPNWMGALGWINHALLAVNIILFLVFYSWVWSLLIIAYGLALTGIFDAFTPLPTYSHCFNIISKHLDGEEERAKKENNKELLEAIRLLKRQVKNSREKHRL